MDTYSPQPQAGGITPTLQVAEDNQIYNYVAFSAFTLIVYDTILTIPHGINYFKTRHVNVVPVLYACAQFGTMGSLAFAAFLNSELSFLSTSACNSLSFAQDLCFGFAAIGIQGLLLGRAYAIAPHNKKSMVFLGFVYMVNVGSAFGFFYWWKCDVFEGNSFATLYVTIFCRPLIVILTQLVLSGEGIIGEASLIVFDIGVLVTTLYHAWAIRGGVSRAFRVSLRPDSEHAPRSLTDIFIRQGIFRFLLIATWSTADAFVYKFVRPSIAGVDEPLEMAISPILLSRFLFQLRKTYAGESDEPSNQPELTAFQAAVRSIETNIRMELGDNDITESDHIRHPSPGNISLDSSFRQDLESLGNYAGGETEDNDDNIRQRTEEP